MIKDSRYSPAKAYLPALPNETNTDNHPTFNDIARKAIELSNDKKKYGDHDAASLKLKNLLLNITI